MSKHKIEVEVNMYWSLENEVANNFNRLKAKIFNLIEASLPDKTQQEAMKGLVRGFANDEYKLCLDNMRYCAKEGGLIDGDGAGVPATAMPLENRTF